MKRLSMKYSTFFIHHLSSFCDQKRKTVWYCVTLSLTNWKRIIVETPVWPFLINYVKYFIDFVIGQIISLKIPYNALWKLTETGHSPVMIVIIESVNIFDIIHKISFKKTTQTCCYILEKMEQFFFYIRKFKGMTIWLLRIVHHSVFTCVQMEK